MKQNAPILTKLSKMYDDFMKGLASGLLHVLDGPITCSRARKLCLHSWKFKGNKHIEYINLSLKNKIESESSLYNNIYQNNVLFYNEQILIYAGSNNLN